MTAEIVTREDLQLFRIQLLGDLKELLKSQPANVEKKWLKGREVKQLLNISSNTLQGLRVSGKIRFSRVGSILYYRYEDLQKLLDKNYV
jgi:hypothetical protein